jgi:hypothetical protein
MDSPLMVEAEDGYKVVLSTRSIPFPVLKFIEFIAVLSFH